jgi:hypothetical protein
VVQKFVVLLAPLAGLLLVLVLDRWKSVVLGGMPTDDPSREPHLSSRGYAASGIADPA